MGGAFISGESVTGGGRNEAGGAGGGGASVTLAVSLPEARVGGGAFPLPVVIAAANSGAASGRGAGGLTALFALPGTSAAAAVALAVAYNRSDFKKNMFVWNFEKYSKFKWKKDLSIMRK